MATGAVAQLQADTTLKVGVVADLRVTTGTSPQGIVAELRAGGASATGLVAELSVNTVATTTGNRCRAVGGVWTPTVRKHATGGAWV